MCGNPESLPGVGRAVAYPCPRVTLYTSHRVYFLDSTSLPHYSPYSTLLLLCCSLILALSLLSLADVLVVGDPIHVPVRRVRSGQKTDLNEIARRVKVKYGFPDTLPSRRSRRASSTIHTNGRPGNLFRPTYVSICPSLDTTY